MTRRILMFLLLAITASAATASAQEVVVDTSGPPPALRANIQAFRKALNGSAADFEAMTKDVYTPAALKAQTPAQRKALFDTVRAACGTVEFEQLMREGGPDAPLQIPVKGATGAGVIWVDLDDATHKFAAVRFEPAKHDRSRH
jgi:hypothetical protein